MPTDLLHKTPSKWPEGRLSREQVPAAAAAAVDAGWPGQAAIAAGHSLPNAITERTEFNLCEQPSSVLGQK